MRCNRCVQDVYCRVLQLQSSKSYRWEHVATTWFLSFTDLAIKNGSHLRHFPYGKCAILIVAAVIYTGTKIYSKFQALGL